MEVFSNILENTFKNSAVTLGKFNGLHRGHQKLISHLIDEKADNLVPVLFSFDTTPHEAQVSLTTRTDKIELCEKMGIEKMILYPVNEKTMAITAEEFIENILIKQLDSKVVVTGNDFHFGKNRQGNVEMLMRYSQIYGYELIVEDSLMYGNTKISSSCIKEKIKSGDMETASEMLGYKYFIAGEIIHGRQIGRTIDRRTINLLIDMEKIVPPDGVYATDTIINEKKYKSVTNIGTCPTVSDEGRRTIETHLLNFDMDVYGKKAKVIFKKIIRKEKKFDNIEELKEQISKDVQIAEKCD